MEIGKTDRNDGHQPRLGLNLKNKLKIRILKTKTGPQTANAALG